MTDWKEWRRTINAAIVAPQATGTVKYERDDMEVLVCFYLSGHKLTILDVDNRVKDVLGALQGFVGDKGKRRLLTPIIMNDNQIYRVIAEKRLPPKYDRQAKSTIVIRPYSNHSSTVRSIRERRKHVL
jgi:hypothetical protein